MDEGRFKEGGYCSRSGTKSGASVSIQCTIHVGLKGFFL